LPRYEYEARRALADIERRDRPAAAAARLEALRCDARARGFGLFAR
jgi:hypothetical protein